MTFTPHSLMSLICWTEKERQWKSQTALWHSHLTLKLPWFAGEREKLGWNKRSFQTFLFQSLHADTPALSSPENRITSPEALMSCIFSDNSQPFTSPLRMKAERFENPETMRGVREAACSQGPARLEESWKQSAQEECSMLMTSSDHFLEPSTAVMWSKTH